MDKSQLCASPLHISSTDLLDRFEIWYWQSALEIVILVVQVQSLPYVKLELKLLFLDMAYCTHTCEHTHTHQNLKRKVHT
jgi:hypothetical protein